MRAWMPSGTIPWAKATGVASGSVRSSWSASAAAATRGVMQGEPSTPDQPMLPETSIATTNRRPDGTTDPNER